MKRLSVFFVLRENCELFFKVELTQVCRNRIRIETSMPIHCKLHQSRSIWLPTVNQTFKVQTFLRNLGFLHQFFNIYNSLRYAKTI